MGNTQPQFTVHGSRFTAFEPWARSAFRVLGVGASASQAEVFEAAEALGLAARLGAEKRFESDLSWLGAVSRTDAEVRDALGRLSDPPRRAAERLFWFHTPSAAARPASVEELRREADQILVRGGAAARHDAALLLLAGLHALDPRLRQRAAWAEAFRLWREEVDADEFWSLLVAADLRGEYEQLLTFNEAAELRLQTPRLVSQSVAGVAVSEAAAENHAGVGRALAILRAASLPRPLLEGYENEALGPLEERAEQVCDLSFGFVSLMAHSASLPPSELKERHFDPAVYRFCAEAKPELFKFLDAAGADSYHLRRLARHAAARLNELAGYYRDGGWTDQAVYVYRTARALAPDAAEEFEDAGAALREMGAGDEKDEGGVREGYVVRLARELSAQRPPAKLFKAPPAAVTSKGDPTFKGCLAQIAFYALMICACFVLDKCGVINMSRRSAYPPAYNFNSFNFNYNYRMPVPQFSPVPIPDLLPPGAVKRLTAAELRRRVRRGSVVVVDVRALADYEAGHIAGALSAPGGEVGARLEEWRRRRRQIVFYSAGPDDGAGFAAARRLWVAGLKDVAVLDGGLAAWRAADLPVERSAAADAPPSVAPRRN